jgi:hypothetical protein
MRKIKYENKKLKLNYDLKDHKKGDVINVSTVDGLPVNKFWRNRVYDSKIDNCVEFVESQEKQVKHKRKTTLKDREE